MDLLIVLDFDGTITEEDTIDSLARFAVYYAPTDSRSITPMGDGPTSPVFLLPSPKLSGLDDLVNDKFVFRLEPATGDKPFPAEEKEHAAREEDTTISETTPQPLSSNASVKSFQPSSRVSSAKSLRDLALSTSPRHSSPSTSVGGLTLSASVKSPTPSFISSTSLLDIWNFTLVEGYIRDVHKFESEYKPSEDERLKWEDEEEFLEKLNAVELESMKRVESSPLFRKFGDEDFRRFGRDAVRIGAKGANTRPLVDSRPGPHIELRPVKIRTGFNGFVRQASLGQWKLGLVSINWSQEFIEGVLDASNDNSDSPDGPVDDENPDEDITGNANNDNKNGSRSSTEMDLDQPNNGIENGSHPSTEMDLDESDDGMSLDGSDADSDLTRVAGELRLDSTLKYFARIVANHISSEGNIEGPPTWKRPIITAKDKETAFGELKDEVGGCEKSVYIGDSRTDLLCLRAADLGIAIASDPNRSGLLKTLRRLAGDIPHVSEAVTMPGTKLAWARNFEEILQSKILDNLSQKGE